MSFNVNYGFRNCLDPKVFESNKDFERNFYTFADLNRIYNEKLIDEMLTVVENDTTSQNNKEENTNINETENEQVAVQYDVFKAFLDKLASPKPPQEEDLIAEDDISNDAERLLKVDNPLYLPTRQHVRLLVTSSDVLHS
jgi:heme/copper-type cytochrome/quinol oxidase subunit 2